MSDERPTFANEAGRPGRGGRWGRCHVCKLRKQLRAWWLRCDDCLEQALRAEKETA